MYDPLTNPHPADTRSQRRLYPDTVSRPDVTYKPQPPYSFEMVRQVYSCLQETNMEMRHFSRANRERCEAADGFNHKLSDWSLSDWMTATVGELGEAANVAKKLNRVRDGIPGNAESEAELRASLADELADAFVYLDLLCQSQGISLEAAVVRKFNRTSDKIGYGVPLDKSRLMREAANA